MSIKISFNNQFPLCTSRGSKCHFLQKLKMYVYSYVFSCIKTDHDDKNWFEPFSYSVALPQKNVKTYRVDPLFISFWGCWKRIWPSQIMSIVQPTNHLISSYAGWNFNFLAKSRLCSKILLLGIGNPNTIWKTIYFFFH